MDIDAFTRPLHAVGELDVRERSIGPEGCTVLPGRRHPA